MNFALRLYRRLADAFPHEFKMIYGTDVMQLGEDVVEEIAKEHGVVGLFRLIADIAIRVPIEYLSEMRRDMIYAMRALIKSPGFALVGIISLGLGIGVTTSVFTTLWAMMFRPLAGVVKSDELVVSLNPQSYWAVEQFREHKDLVAGAAAFQNGVPFNVSFGGEKPERVFGHLVSTNYFDVLGVKAQRGRMLTPNLDKPGDAPVVVISDRFWHDRLNSATDAIGRTLRLNGQTATIVGIGPKDFNGAMPFVPADLFVPITVPAALAPELANDVVNKRDAKEFIPLIRMAPGVAFQAEEAGLDTIARHLEEQITSAPASTDRSRRVTLGDGGTMFPIPRTLIPVFMTFYAALIGLILTIACMNLANMLLARGAARRKELAIRIAVGASRFRLIRQMLAEGILLAMLGAAAGLALAYWLARLSSQMKLPLGVPTQFNYSLDWHALALTCLLAVVCGIGFSLAPALQATKADIAPTLKEGSSPELRGFRKFGMRNLLVVCQVAGSLMLLLITGFLVVGITKNAGVQTHFDPNTMYLLSIDPVRDGYSAEKAQALFEKLPERLRNVGAVSAVALASDPPFSIIGGSSGLDAKAPNGSIVQDGSTVKTVRDMGRDKVGAGYFATLQEKMLAGRDFEDRDQRMDADASKNVAMPVVLNQSAAGQLFGNGNAVGQRLAEGDKSYDVIGVVRDMKSGFATGQASGVMYLPLTRRDFASPPSGGMIIMVRSSAGSEALAGVRREIASIDPNLAVFNVQTLADYLDISKAYLRIALNIYGGIGVFGLLLAAIGLAGVTAYAVARRRKEIGIRMALGAKKSQVLRLVLKEGAALVTVGIVLGILGGRALSKILSALTSILGDAFGTSANDPRLVFGAPLLLAALAMLACYIPARRSAKIDPLKALREE